MTEKTPLWTCEDIAAAVDGKTTSSGPVSGVSIDSRTLEAGDLFVPLKGEIADGHAYIPQAIEKQNRLPPLLLAEPVTIVQGRNRGL